MLFGRNSIQQSNHFIIQRLYKTNTNYLYLNINYPTNQYYIIFYSILEDQMSFRQFLAILASKNQTPATRFTLGNASVDYDSFFGSIVLAYILTQASGNLYVPLIDCPKKELKLRFEIQAVLEKMQIDPNIFQYREHPEQPYPEGLYSLYDHNKRQKKLNIQYIIDHHQFNPNEIHAKKYLIDKMGSAVSLLYYLLQPHKLKQFSKEQLEGTSFIQKLLEFTKGEPFEKLSNNKTIDKDVKEIIRYGILLDTFGLDPKQSSRWTIFDQKALSFIQKEHSFQLGNQWLQSIKYDTHKNLSLTLQLLLAKDRKLYTYGQLKCIYSIILISPKIFYSHFEKQIKSELNPHQGCDIYILMTAFKDENNQFRRQVIYRIEDKHKDLIQKQLDACFKQLHLIERGTFGEWKWVEDPSTTMSRKSFEPSIAKALQNI